MLRVLAIENYRSLRSLKLELGSLTVVAGGNGSGKTSLYRALRLLADIAQGRIISSVAHEGGLESCFWAGSRSKSEYGSSSQIKLGFSGENFSYSLSLGVPAMSTKTRLSETLFGMDPEIKQETIWAGPVYRSAAVLVAREFGSLRCRDGKQWCTLSSSLPEYQSLFDFGGSIEFSEITHVRNILRSWRFYDGFRTDRESPARKPQIGTRSFVLDDCGKNLASVLQTIREVGDRQGLDDAIDDAFPGSYLDVVNSRGIFNLYLHQKGLSRALHVGELSDGTLKYLLLVAALFSPRSPELIVLNEPESSLNADLLPALSRLIVQASRTCQVWVISHADLLIKELSSSEGARMIYLEKVDGETRVANCGGLLLGPIWKWPG